MLVIISHFCRSNFKLFSIIEGLNYLMKVATMENFFVSAEFSALIICELTFSKLCYALTIRLLSHAAILYFLFQF